jgi:phage terminase large subunit-like protein
LVRIVVAIDPAVSTGEDADETGIVARFLKFGKPSRSFNCYARTAKAKRAA